MESYRDTGVEHSAIPDYSAIQFHFWSVIKNVEAKFKFSCKIARVEAGENLPCGGGSPKSELGEAGCPDVKVKHRIIEIRRLP